MAKFQQGHKLAKGGARPGAGRPSKHKREVKKLAAQLAAEFIEKHTKTVLDTYLKNARGHYEDRYTDEGKKYQEFVVDPASTRHWIDKVTPSAKQRIEVSGKIENTIDREALREVMGDPEVERLASEFVELMLAKKHGTRSSEN